MIIVRAPLRMSFVGGGTDIADFYTRSPGRVLSATIDKYIFVVINRMPFNKHIVARYSSIETVDHPSKLQHHRIREALIDAGIGGSIEVGHFSHLPARIGLGSSSSFSVALVKGLAVYQGKRISAEEAAQAACRLEIDLVKEPIGKQDQYAAAFGGFNVFQFNADGSVDVEPLYMDYKNRFALETHALLFFTGITRDASVVLAEQKKHMAREDNFGSLKKMADLVPVFKECLMSGQIKRAAELLHENWMMKKTLAAGISNPAIDALYDAGVSAGAWGGKVLGAGGGGCILFLAPPETHDKIRKEACDVAGAYGLADFKEIPFSFTQAGAEIVFNDSGSMAS